jgi:hypothetical protein
VTGLRDTVGVIGMTQAGGRLFQEFDTIAGHVWSRFHSPVRGTQPIYMTNITPFQTCPPPHS